MSRSYNSYNRRDISHHQSHKPRVFTKYTPGCGGINCPCCNEMNPCDFKPLERRTIRRKEKQKLNAEIEL